VDTIQGVRTKVVLVSFSHGAVRVGLQQTFSVTPRFTERTINEFDNLEPALVVTTYDAVDCSFEYLDSDSKLVDAAVNDQDPGAVVVVDDPSAYQPLNLFANSKSLTSGKIFASTLVKGCMAKGSPQTEPVKEEKRVTRDLTGLNVLNLKGAGIYYQRMLASSPASTVYLQAIPPNAYTDKNLASSGDYRVSNARDALLVKGNYYLLVLKNGVEVETGFTMSRDFFHVTSAPAVTDIWEVFYAFDDTVEASSNSSSSRSSSSSCKSSSSSSSSSSS
jgi:hypothetical protein